jgi:hypothetical protein
MHSVLKLGPNFVSIWFSIHLLFLSSSCLLLIFYMFFLIKDSFTGHEILSYNFDSGAAKRAADAP